MTSQSFYIAVCDDEPADREKIAEMTKTVCEQEDIHAEITCFETAQELFDELLDGKPFHLLLLDVVMPAQNGMELARQIRRGNKEIPIVFISSDRDMALQGYEVEVVRYLAKPVSLEKLREAVVICHKECRKQKPLYISENGGIRKIVPGDICYIETIGRKSRIWQEEEMWETGMSVAKLDQILQEYGFIRCHQSFLVNCKYICRLRTSMIELTDGIKIPVSKHRVKEVRQAFFDYMKN